MKFLNFALIIIFLICSAESCFEKKEPIKPLPTKASFDFKIGKNGEIEFTNTSANATRFFWNFGNGETSTEKSPIYIYKENGSYTVKLRAQSTESTDSLEKIVEIKDIPVENYVFICEDQGTCSLLNAASGKKIWDYKLYPYIISSPTFDKGQLFVATTGDGGNSTEIGEIISLDFEKGTKNWKFKADYILSSPMVANDKIYFIASYNGTNGKLYCLNTKDGKVIWEVTSNEFVDSSPTIYNGLVYIVGKSGLQILDAENGNIIKNARIQNEVFNNSRFKSPQGFNFHNSSPVINNGICYYSSPKMLFL